MINWCISAQLLHTQKRRTEQLILDSVLMEASGGDVGRWVIQQLMTAYSYYSHIHQAQQQTEESQKSSGEGGTVTWCYLTLPLGPERTTWQIVQLCIQQEHQCPQRTQGWKWFRQAWTDWCGRQDSTRPWSARGVWSATVSHQPSLICSTNYLRNLFVCAPIKLTRQHLYRSRSPDTRVCVSHAWSKTWGHAPH